MLCLQASGETIPKAVEAPEKEAPPKAPVAPTPKPPEPAPPVYPYPRRSFAEIAVDRLYGSIEDVGRHVWRGISDLPSTKAIDKLVRGKGGQLTLKSEKPIVLLLGSGWAAHSIIKVIDTDTFEVVLVSPRNHFLFTPMLPSTAVGTIEFRSLLDPIRTANPFVDYFEANCEHLDVKNKVARCVSAFTKRDGQKVEFEIPYDIVVVAVGEQQATFGIPGVKEHCFFMKEVQHAVSLRRQIGENFELAALPDTSEEEMKRLLHFVVVGGGPTGKD